MDVACLLLLSCTLLSVRFYIYTRSSVLCSHKRYALVLMAAAQWNRSMEQIRRMSFSQNRSLALSFLSLQQVSFCLTCTKALGLVWITSRYEEAWPGRHMHPTPRPLSPRWLVCWAAEASHAFVSDEPCGARRRHTSASGPISQSGEWGETQSRTGSRHKRIGAALLRALYDRQTTRNGEHGFMEGAAGRRAGHCDNGEGQPIADGSRDVVPNHTSLSGVGDPGERHGRAR